MLSLSPPHTAAAAPSVVQYRIRQATNQLVGSVAVVYSAFVHQFGVYGKSVQQQTNARARHSVYKCF